MISSRLSAVLPLIIAGFLAIGTGFLPSSLAMVRSASFLFLLVFSAGILGQRLAPRLPQILYWIIGGSTLIACQSILQTAWYYLGGTLGAFSDGMTLGAGLFLLSLLASLPFLHVKDPVPSEPSLNENSITPGETAWTTFAVVSFVAAGLFLFVSASSHATTHSTNTPWTLFPPGTFIAVCALFASQFLTTLKSRPSVTVLLTSLALLLIASLTIFVYPLGYGFDGFLHRASEEVILRTGTLEPAPPSYIGQYTLVTWLERVVHIPHERGDRWLIGALALLLPIAALRLSSRKKSGALMSALLLTLPLGILSATTPQNVAYLLGLTALFWLISGAVHRSVPWLFLMWSVATHPLAGLPFFFLGIALSTYDFFSPRLKQGITGVALLGTVFGVPLAFALRAAAQGTGWSWTWLRAFPSSISWLLERFQTPATHLALWPDWANWQAYLLPFVLVGAVLFAVAKDHARRSTWLTLLFFSLAASASSWLLHTSGDFSFLISYERQDYATRLLTVAHLFLVPGAIVGMSLWFEWIERMHPRMRAAALLIALAWFSAQVYNAFPRHDAAAISHGWSVGQSDLEAVTFIDKQANGQPYTVLANQTVSAAAISRFGFKRYVGDIFYYPIPTGGPLYETFLEMMEHPDREIAEEAGSLGQSTLVYVVVNQYWFKSEQIIERLKSIADRTWNVERGTAYLFLFDLNRASQASTTRSGS